MGRGLKHREWRRTGRLPLRTCIVTDDRLPSIHPGEVLREEFLNELGITPYRLAKDLQIPLTRVTAILARKRGITADTALRLSKYFGNSARFWLNLQSAYELQEASANNASFKSITRCSKIPQAQPSA